jgi:hypothetical protein
LADLDAAGATSTLAELPRVELPFADWVITCIAYPKAPDKRNAGGGLLGSRSSPGAIFSRNTERIRESVRTKGRKYGELGSLNKALLVAVLSVNNFAEQRDVTDAMFGSVTPKATRQGVEWIRDQDGYWRGPGSDRGAKVSAVLFSHDMYPWSVASHLPAVWINPWADKHITSHPPLTTVTVIDSGEILETPPEATPRDVFGPNI